MDCIYCNSIYINNFNNEKIIFQNLNGEIFYIKTEVFNKLCPVMGIGGTIHKIPHLEKF